MLENIFQIVHRAKAGGLGTNQRAAVAEALAGQDAVFKRTLQPAVFAVKITDFPRANAHVSRRDVHVRSNITIQSLHEALAEAHNLRVGLARRVKVGTALAAADGQAGQAVFEHLLKAQEFDNAGVYVFLEPQAALVGTDGSVELAAVANIGMPCAVVGHPADAEGEHPLRFHHPGQQVRRFVLRMLFDDRFQRRQNLLHRLNKLRLVRVPLLHMRDHAGKICVHLNQDLLLCDFDKYFLHYIFTLPERMGRRSKETT